ncbi:T9SS type A sorting domain-containing protein [candidate division KSB1 bacterium]|nr:T9SS type A sorting domain-containing protein [candidate division KSB1 bacterium]
MITNTKKEDYLIEVRNIIGQLVYTEQIDDVSGNFTKEIDLSGHKGVYFLHISNSSSTSS